MLAGVLSQGSTSAMGHTPATQPQLTSLAS